MAVGLAIAAAVLLTGCSAKEPVRVFLVPTQSLNQDDSGAPLPVVIRLYQLTGKERFEKASFTSLWKNDKEVLENDLLERKEITLFPESPTQVDWEVDTKKGGQYVGVMALFRNPEGSAWRQVLSVKEHGLNPFTTRTVKLIVGKSTVVLAEKD